MADESARSVKQMAFKSKQDLDRARIDRLAGQLSEEKFRRQMAESRVCDLERIVAELRTRAQNYADALERSQEKEEYLRDSLIGCNKWFERLRSVLDEVDRSWSQDEVSSHVRSRKP